MKQETKRPVRVSAPPGPVYGLGFIGALVYYFQTADGFWNFVLGFLEAIVWPALLIHKALEVLKL